MLKIENASKKYGKKVVLNNITLSFEPGKIYALIGPNGCGKTMILKALAGYIKLDEGTVYQNGTEIQGDNKFIENAGIIIENPSFIPDDTLYENLQFITKFCNNKINLDKWIHFYELEEHKNKKYAELSLGTKQKMLLIQAFMDNPDIYLLDECINALDNLSVKKTIKYLLNERDKGKTIIMTSHIDTIIKKISDVKIFIEEGKVVN